MKFELQHSKIAEELVSSMSVNELIDQCVCPSLGVKTVTDAKEYGSIFIHASENKLIKEVIKNYKAKCKIPPLIAGDFESGPRGMLTDSYKFPSQMGVSQTNSTELTYEIGKLTAMEVLNTGYNWSFSPCVDISAVSHNPIVLNRSYGETPEQVIKIATAYMNGMQDMGLITSAKHFPGDGYDFYDQHLTTTINNLSMDEWYNKSGKCFKALIVSGVKAIMPGHISLPAYDTPDEKLGICPPATLSYPLMTKLLKGELGFDGIIVSDAINMNGAVGFMSYYEACATFWENGGDVLLFVEMDGFYDEMDKLIKKGILSIETLKNRAYRILCFKVQMGLFGTSEHIERMDDESQQKLLEETVQKSITLVRDRENLLPQNINKDTRILHVIVMNDSENYKIYTDEITSELKKLSENVVEMSDPGPDTLFFDIRNNKYDLVICSIGGALSYGLNVARLHGPVARNMMHGWTKLGTPVIFVSPLQPYIHKEYETSIDTIINTYGITIFTAKEVIKKIIGAESINKNLYAHS